MRVLFDSSGDHMLNHGDLAMLKVAARRFHESGIEVSVVSDNSVECSNQLNFVDAVQNRVSTCSRLQLLAEVNKVNHGGRGIGDMLRSLRGFLNVSSNRFQFWSPQNVSVGCSERDYLSTLRSVDAVCVSGGGWINDCFVDAALSVLATIGLAQQFGKPTYLFGQGIGPVVNSTVLELARRVLPEVRFIGVRDRSSLDLAASLGVQSGRCVFTGDDAIELANDIESKHEEERFGFNIRNVGYANIVADALVPVCNVLGQFRDRHSFIPSIVPISKVNNEDFDSTLGFLRQAGIDVRSCVNIIFSPELAAKEIGRCRAFLTTSYHTAVFAMTLGVPAIMVANSDFYTMKFMGLAEYFGQDMFVIQLRDVARDLPRAISVAWEMPTEQRLEMRVRGREIMDLSKRFYTHVVKDLQRLNAQR